MRGPPSFKKLFLAAFLIHGVLLLFLSPSSLKPPRRGKIVIHTLPSVAIQTKAQAPSPKKGAAQKLKPKPSQKPTASKEVKSEKKPSKEWLREMAKELKTLEEGGGEKEAKRPELPLPSRVEWIPRVEESSLEAEEFETALLSALQRELSLPEKGAVKMELSINFKQNTLSCKVLETKSKKNSAFLEEALPKISLSGLYPSKNQSDKITIIVTFSNI